MSETELPTRDRIAAVLYETEFSGSYHVEWERLVDDARNRWLGHADAVLALLVPAFDGALLAAYRDGYADAATDGAGAGQ